MLELLASMIASVGGATGFAPITTPEENTFCQGTHDEDIFFTYDLGDDFGFIHLDGQNLKITVPPTLDQSSHHPNEAIVWNPLNPGTPWYGASAKVTFELNDEPTEIHRDESDSTSIYDATMIATTSGATHQQQLQIVCGL